MIDRQFATVELLGALTYAQLRAFEVTARAVRAAPDAREADVIADYSLSEHHGYVLLRERLRQLTDLPGPVIYRQKARTDEFFDHAPVDAAWEEACTFFAVGLPLAADFSREIGPSLDPETAAVLVAALADREPFEGYAREQLAAFLEREPDERDRIRSLVGDLTGRVLTLFQGAIGDTDALAVLLRASAKDRNAVVRHLAMRVLEGHRRRMHALGLEDLD